MRALQRPQVSQLVGWFGGGVLAAGLLGAMGIPAIAQDAVPNEVRPAAQNTGRLSVAAADQLVEEASAAIASQNYPQAIQKLQEARELYNQLSTYYQELAAMFVGVDGRANTSNRRKALETAQRRDQATYQLALLYRTQNRPAEAVPLFIEILRSQQPTRDLGQRAYQQLFEMGFVDEPYNN